MIPKIQPGKTRAIAALALACGAGLPAAASVCSPLSGLTIPAEICGASHPCTNPLVLNEPGGVGPGPIMIASQIPDCSTHSPAPYPRFDDGPADAVNDREGTTRYLCEYHPAATKSPLPLVLFFHGAGGMASDLYDQTLLRAKADGFSLSTGGAGFHLVSVQGRNLHDPSGVRPDGPKHDSYHRDVSESSDNADIALADRIIDEAVAAGSVDARRIYLIGWSNGGHFAQLYAISRHSQPTPGGNRVAAAAIYSASDPYRIEGLDSCRADPYPSSDVPLYLASRDCDLVACSASQRSSLRSQGLDAGYDVSDWVSDLRGMVGDPNVRRQIIKGNGASASACAASCRPLQALKNHLAWPNGINDGGGIDYEVAMLTYLKDHPLPSAGGGPPPARCPSVCPQKSPHPTVAFNGNGRGFSMVGIGGSANIEVTGSDDTLDLGGNGSECIRFSGRRLTILQRGGGSNCVNGLAIPPGAARIEIPD